MNLILALDNIRSTYNVGAILRTAEGFGIQTVIFGGITPMPNDPTLLPHIRDKIDHQIAKSALGAESLLTFKRAHDLSVELTSARTAGLQILGLENHLQSDKLYQLDSPVLSAKLSDSALLVLGEEVHGINPALFPLIDLFLEIPMTGKKESFNVSVATGIALYALLHR